MSLRDTVSDTVAQDVCVKDVVNEGLPVVEPERDELAHKLGDSVSERVCDGLDE